MTPTSVSTGTLLARLTGAALSRPVSTGALLTGVLLFGTIALTRLPVALLPDLSVPVITVHTGFPTAAAAELSRTVAPVIEAALAGVPGIVDLRSVSRPGSVRTTVRFAWGTDMRATVLAARERLDAARDRLPDRAERPALRLSDPAARPIAMLAVRTAPGRGVLDLREMIRIVRTVHIRRLEQLDGVAHVALIGAPDEEVRVVLNGNRLRTLQLSAADVAAAVARENAPGVSGTLQRGPYRLPVRAVTELDDPAALLHVPLDAVGNGRPLRLRDVGEVTTTLADPVMRTRFDGADAVGLVVYKDAGANTVTVARALEHTIGELAVAEPTLRMTVVATQAAFVLDALANLGQEIIAGALLSLLVILLVLRDLRMALAIGLTVPLSVLVSLVLLQQLEVSINVLSLGGLALGTGLLVDTAIVVVEAVRAHEADGVPRHAAIRRGIAEVAGPLGAGTLTTILVFAPILFVRGLGAALFRDLSLSVVTTVAVSLLLSLTILPVAMSRHRRRDCNRGRDRGRGGGGDRGRDFVPDRGCQRGATHGRCRMPLGWWRLMRRVAAAGVSMMATWGSDAYDRGVRWSLRHPRIVVVSAVALLVMTMRIARRLPTEVLPRVEEGVMAAALTLPTGTTLDATMTQVRRIEQAAWRLGSRGVFARAGAATDDALSPDDIVGPAASAQLLLPVPRAMSSALFAARLRAALPDLAHGALTLDPAPQSEFSALIGRAGRLINVEVAAPDEVTGEQVIERIRARLAAIPGLADVRQVDAASQRQLRIALDRERMLARGVPPAQVAHVLAGLFGDLPAGDLRATDHRTPIVVRQSGGGHDLLVAATHLSVRGIAIGRLTTTHDERTPLELVRVGQRPVHLIEAQVEQGGTARAVEQIRRALATLPLPHGVHWNISGADRERQRTSHELLLAALLATALIYLVLAAEFGSLTMPLLVMCTVPLAGAGAIIALWWTGQSLNAVSLIGLVVMIGMADNEAVVKLDAIRTARERGLAITDAIREGGHRRLRAITMTSLTTVTGVLPLLFGWGSGGSLYKPLAASIVGGSVSAVLVTFFLLPAVCLLSKQPRAASVRAC